MKKVLLGALVGSIILFGWQSFSWTGMGIHDETYSYAPAQDSVIDFLQKQLKTTGQYRIPNNLPGNSNDNEAFWKSREGKPWAIVTYHDYYKYDMLSPTLRGFLISFICVLILCINIEQFNKKKFWRILLTALSYGIVSFLFVSYNQHNWFQTPWSVLNGELIDAIAAWGLSGLWLGVWFSQK